MAGRRLHVGHRRVPDVNPTALCSSGSLLAMVQKESQWAGHVFRAPTKRAIVTAMNGQVNALRPMGKPRKRWSDNVREDAQRLGVGDWRRAALNRDNWRTAVTAAVGLKVL